MSGPREKSFIRRQLESLMDTVSPARSSDPSRATDLGPMSKHIHQQSPAPRPPPFSELPAAPFVGRPR